jgi:tRNA-Thr(GGU) m(6)t(6)A37 methyltransferase TsaA
MKYLGDHQPALTVIYCQLLEPSGSWKLKPLQQRKKSFAVPIKGGNMSSFLYTIEPIGVVRSKLTSEDAPMQGDEGAPEAWLELTAGAAPGLMGIMPGDELIVLTWLHLAERDVLQVHPRGDLNRPLTGVFATRSPDRPNPIGLHRVAVLEVKEETLRVAPLEASMEPPLWMNLSWLDRHLSANSMHCVSLH